MPRPSFNRYNRFRPFCWSRPSKRPRPTSKKLPGSASEVCDDHAGQSAVLCQNRTIPASRQPPHSSGRISESRVLSSAGDADAGVEHSASARSASGNPSLPAKLTSSRCKPCRAKAKSVNCWKTTSISWWTTFLPGAEWVARQCARRGRVTEGAHQCHHLSAVSSETIDRVASR